MTDTIIAFPKPTARPSLPVRETGVALRGTTQPVVGLPMGGGSARATVQSAIPIDALYPATKESAPDVLIALGLLADAIALLEEARTASKARDMVMADRYVQRFQAALPGLFTPRGIGDGYGVIINSLHFAFINQRGKPLSFDQLTTVWRVLRELRNGPFVQFEQALDYVGELETSGLQIDPEAISELLDDTDDEDE
jgi:hypothetical protein